MLIDLSELAPNHVYYTMTQTLIPRPIAWTLSENENGSYNLAPFSYFSGIASDPPLLMISIGKKPDGNRKDTWVNIDERKEFVVHIPHREEAGKVTATSSSLPPGDSEVDMLELKTVPVPGFRLPRLADARVAYMCEKYDIIEMGALPQGLVIGRIRAVYIDDSAAVMKENGTLKVDFRRINPLGRLGSDEFSVMGEIVTVRRPRHPGQ